MMRRILILFVTYVIAGCTPELIPRPVTPPPSAAPATPTPTALAAPVVKTPGLTTITMFDENNGWGISDSSILRTLDGGVTWYDLTPENIGPLGYAANSDFLDTNHGWVLLADPNDMLKGTLYSTSDGGLSWEHVQVPFGGGAMRFLDGKHGWMMASLGAGAGSMAVAIFQTEDGGATWKQTFSDDPNNPNANDTLPLGGLKDNITPLDMRSAFVGGVTYAPGVIYLYRTSDGGASWQKVTVKPPTGYEQAQFETLGPLFVDGQTAYLPVSVSSQNGVMRAMYVSRDGGASWLTTPTMIPQGNYPDFVSGKDGFDWNGTDFYVTHDGAQTWNTVNPDVAFGESFSGMDFVSATTGYVLTSDSSGARGLYKTTDGGATWNVLGK